MDSTNAYWSSAWASPAWPRRLFLKARGARVTVSDAKTAGPTRHEIPLLLDHGIAVETGGHGERTFRGQDLIVVSPGVPVDAPPAGTGAGHGRER